LFEKSGFSLGSKEEIRLMVVQKLRSLMTSRFNQVVFDVNNKYSLVLANTDERLIDISMEVLDTSDS
jgi:Zn-dependent oligopeptidase